MKSVETEGKTIEEAVNRACSELQVSREDLEIEVLANSSSGFLGLGAKNAKEMLFCWNGKSFMCISFEKKCLCPTCPVTGDLGLKKQSFCTRGSEKAQRYEHTLWGTKVIE